MSEVITHEQLLRLVDRLPGAVSMSRLDPKTGASKLIHRSQNLPAMFGVTHEALQKNPFSAFEKMLPEERAEIESGVARCLQTLETLFWTGRVVDPDGTTRWVQTQVAFERDPDGTVVAFSQAFDITERRRTEEALKASEAERLRSDTLHRTVIDALPVGVLVGTPTMEFPIFNDQQKRFTGGLLERTEDVTGAYGIFKADGVTPMPMEESGMVRCLHGESLEEEVVIRNPRADAAVRAHAVWKPLRDDQGKIYAALGTLQDITKQRALEDEIRARNDQLAKSEEAKIVLIDRLRFAVDELSTPILEVWDDVLVVPLIGVLDSRRVTEMVQKLLAQVAGSQAHSVIIDLTGIEIVDTKTADHLIKLVRKVELVGAACVLTGIQPSVAQTLVDIGVEFTGLQTLRTLKHGLRVSMQHARDLRRGAGSGGDER